jgi:hypothetical protein
MMDKVVVELTNEQVLELYKLLTEEKEEHLELYEVVYQAMFKNLMSRIDRG